MTHCYILLMTGCMCYLTGSMYVVCVTSLDQCMVYVLPHWINVGLPSDTLLHFTNDWMYVLPHWINVCCMCYLTGSMYDVCVTSLDQCMLYVLPHWINVCYMCYLTGSMYVVCVTSLDQCMLYVLPHWINVCCMCYLTGSMYVVCVTSLDQCMLYVLPHWIKVCCMDIQNLFWMKQLYC